MTDKTRNDLIDCAAAALTRLRERAPRVQCLTNTVAQNLTANVLLALGARVSMAAHPDEIVAMTESADALLVNLGTLDQTRVAAIGVLAGSKRVRAMPAVLDPVFVEHSPLRLSLARDVMSWDRVIVKGNASEMTALAGDAIARVQGRIVTGAVDRIVSNGGAIEISNGDPLMAKVTGLGCAVGAAVAAVYAIEADPRVAAAAALLTVEISAEHAAHRSTGPGTFTAYLIDALANFDVRDFALDARIRIMETEA